MVVTDWSVVTLAGVNSDVACLAGCAIASQTKDYMVGEALARIWRAMDKKFDHQYFKWVHAIARTDFNNATSR